MCKVFVAREQLINMDEAKKWGEPVILSSHTGNNEKKDENYGLEPDRIIRQIGRKLMTFDTEKDYLLLDGHLIYNCIAAGILSLFYDQIDLLVWKKGYCHRRLTIPNILKKEIEEKREKMYFAVNEIHDIKLNPLFYFMDVNANVDPYDPETVWPHVTKRARDFSSHDSLILCGSTVMNIVSTIYLSRMLGQFTIGLLHRMTKQYTWRTLTLNKEFVRRLCR